MIHIAFVLITALFIFRAPSAVRRPAARPAWLASGFGLLGLVCLGIVAPLEGLDALLGGSNLWNLAGAISTTASFWFFGRAVQILDRDVAPTRMWPLLALAGVQIGIFLAIPERGSTSSHFIEKHVYSPAVWLYQLVYILSIAAIAASSAYTVRRRLRSIFALFILGYAGVALACLSYAFDITVRHFKIFHQSPLSPFNAGFNALFYPGILLIAVGFTVVYLRYSVKQTLIAWRIRAALLAVVAARLQGGRRTWRVFPAEFSKPDPLGQTYDWLIEIHELISIDGFAPTSLETSVVHRIQHALEHNTTMEPLPAVRERMSI
ncbi:hypothetical protein ACPPVW_18725 [Leifsonia sp. McL0607]|uniref:hypothetical protein n=1 Tax=Leifsonia sp. McL0607 TaxID=3415672 RepID=UPI003CF986DC